MKQATLLFSLLITLTSLSMEKQQKYGQILFSKNTQTATIPGCAKYKLTKNHTVDDITPSSNPQDSLSKESSLLLLQTTTNQNNNKRIYEYTNNDPSPVEQCKKMKNASGEPTPIYNLDNNKMVKPSPKIKIISEQTIKTISKYGHELVIHANKGACRSLNTIIVIPNVAPSSIYIPRNGKLKGDETIQITHDDDFAYIAKYVGNEEPEIMMVLPHQTYPILLGNPHGKRNSTTTLFTLYKSADIEVLVDLFMHALDTTSGEDTLHKISNLLTDKKGIKITVPSISNDYKAIYNSYVVLSILDTLQKVHIYLNDDTSPNELFITYSQDGNYIYLIDKYNNTIASIATPRSIICLQ